MADYRYLEWRLSGGASNTTPASSLGGAMSTVTGGIITSQNFSWTPMTGMVIVGGSGNTAGAGTLAYVTATTSIKWMPYTGAYGPLVNISADGTYIVYDSTLTQFIVVNKATSLPAGNASATVTVSEAMNALFDDVSHANSYAGMTDYRCVYFTNAHGSETMTSLRIWIAQDALGPSVIEIGADGNGVNNDAVSIVNENTAPVGVTFSTPTELSPLTLGTLTAGQRVAFWVKRSVATATENGVASSLTRIGVSWL